MTPSNDIVLISKVLPFCIYIQSVPLWYILWTIDYKGQKFLYKNIEWILLIKL